MSEIVEVRTDYNSKNFMKFNRFHMFKKNVWVVLLSIVIFMFLGITLTFSGDESGIVFIILGLLFPLIMLLVVVITAKLHLKSNKLFDSMKNIYFRFDNELVYNEIVSKDLKVITEFKWDKVHRIYESRDSFYIYISNMQAFIVPKADIVTGSIEDLKNIILNKSVEKKFKSKML